MIPRFQFTILALILCSMMTTACGLAGGGNSVDFSCVLLDERLGTPFKDPAKARAWLIDQGQYLRQVAARIQAKDFVPTPDDFAHLADLADLVDRANSCIAPKTARLSPLFAMRPGVM